ncbi:MAG: hypothetical protein O2818_01690 [Bacteroidetes bacterium]|nr:hypothetical protein [Bacteroidota bacterium]
MLSTKTTPKIAAFETQAKGELWSPKVLTLSLIAFLFFMPNAWGQQSELSPYSRYGFGLIGQLHTPVYAGLGGMETTLVNGYQFNPNNPASATFLNQTTFQSSAIGSRMRLEQGDAPNATAAFGSPGPFGLVVKKQSGKNAFILGASPYSNSGFVITRNTDIEGIGTTQERYEGEGGLNNFNLGWAHVIQGTRFVEAGPNDSLRIQGNALHLGIQTQYLFGQISRTSTVDIIDPTFLDHRSQFAAQHRSITANIGVIYNQLLFARYNALKDFEKSCSIRMGAVFSPETNLHSTVRTIDETTQTLGGIPVSLDTAFFSEQIGFRGRMPQSLSIGSSVHFDRADGMRWAAGVEFKSTRWSQVSADLPAGMLAEGMEWVDSESFHMGLSFNLGNPEQRHPTWGKATYRLGMNQQYQPYQINGSPILAQSFTGGVTIPMVGSRSMSRIHFGTELGERTTEAGALKESFMRIHFGVSLMPFFKNNWLIPRLYD